MINATNEPMPPSSLTTLLRAADSRWLAGLAAGAFVLLLLPGIAGSYGLFIDEFYYVACSKRLAFGYVDHPPLAPLLLWASRMLFGNVELALRVPPALAGALTVFLTGLVAGRLGAGRYGQLLAAGAVATAPAYHVMFGFYSVNAFEILLWLVGCWILVEIVLRDEPRLWVLFGLVAGIGLQNKHTMVLLGLAIALGTLLAPARRQLATRWPWIGLALAALLVLPNVMWQTAHGWPSLEFYRNADLYKNVPTPPHVVLAMQVLFMSPGTLPLWLAGAVFLLAGRDGRRFRHVGLAFLVLMAMILLAQKSRPDRIAGIYPVVIAAGAVWFDRWTAGGRRWLRAALPAWLIAWLVALAPVGLPVLSPARLARYVAAIGVVPQIESGAGKRAELPQWFADRFGWEELAADVAAVAGRLDPAERADAVIFAPSYGQAGALELYGPRHELPPVYSTHNNYFLWGPPERKFGTAVVVGDSEEHVRQLFEEVELAAVHDCDPCMRWRDDMPIWIARRPRPDLAMDQVWQSLKHFE